jgi:glycosyltransferase involved in cell wall biosynthesis
MRAKYPPQNILFVGRLIKIKGILQLLNVYRIVSERSQNPVGLILVGQGPLEKEICEFKKKYQLNNIFLEGFVKYQELPAYYWISDLLVNLGIEDRNPLVLFEALAAGIPVLFSKRVGNAIDFVKDGENGYIVDPFDAEAITLKALELMKWDSAKRECAAIFSRNITKKSNYHDSGKAFVEACRMAVKPF